MTVIDEIFDEVLAGSGGGGITPTGTKQITANGLHDVTQYAAAQVAVPNELLPADWVTGVYKEFDVDISLSILSQYSIDTTISSGSADIVAGVEIDDKIMLHGNVLYNNASCGNYVVWGTVTGFTTVDDTERVKIKIAGVATHMTTNFRQNINKNATYYMTGYTKATVNVPNSYGESDEGKVVSSGALVSQTSKSVSENGTYDTTNNNQVVVNVPSSGVSEKWAKLLTAPFEKGSVDLSDADVPAGRSIELSDSIFKNNSALRSLSSEQATYIEAYALYGCGNITSLYLPNITYIGQYALAECGSFENWDCDFNNSLRKVQSINTRAFDGSAVDGDLVFPAVTVMNSQAFGYTKYITGVSLPNYTGSIPSTVAQYATGLRFFEAPLSTGTVGTSAFISCMSLVYAIFGAITSISTTVFMACTSLKYIVIGGSTVCSLANVNAFQGCSALESIYVPDNLVDSYKAATNWSTYASQIKPVSEMPAV